MRREIPCSVRSNTSGPEIDEILRWAGFSLTGTEQDLLIEIRWSEDPDLMYDRRFRRESNERYRLEMTDGAAIVTVTGRRSLRWALTDLADRLQEDAESILAVENGPAFALRGMIEGFYGPPWPDSDRLGMIDFAASVRMNTFFYSPKDDPFLRAEWRVPFDEASHQRLLGVIRRCLERDIDPMVGISPGLTLEYSNERDLDLLIEKFQRVIEAGATRIALLFDDIPQRLQHGSDIDRFPDLATAHAEVADRLAEALTTPVAVCPTVYRGRGDEQYVARLGALLDPRIDVFWTGRAICSPEITAAEAALFARAAHRPPLYWDNYPVNDLSMRHEMHVGPYDSRDPLLAHFSRGVLANAMQYPEASKIPLATIADFLWDPDGYEPHSSWRNAIARVAGEEDAEAFALLADNLRSSCLSDGDPHSLTRALEEHAFALATGEAARADSGLSAFASEMVEAATHLLSPDVENFLLQAELRPWLEKFRLGAEALAAFASGRPSSVLDEYRSRLDQDPIRIFGDVLEMTLAEATNGKETRQ